MRITIITLFPGMFSGFLQESIVGKAQQNNFVDIQLVDLRAFAKDAYGTVDDRPYGGGAGMVIRVDVVHACIAHLLGADMAQPGATGKALRKKAGVRIVLTSAKGNTYSQAKAERYAKLNSLILIAGHYEGVDERVLSFVDDEIAIGQYVLTGGELPAAIIADSVVRLIPGVLKKEDAAKEESYSAVPVRELQLLGVAVPDKSVSTQKVRLREAPHYTRPEVFMDMRVPAVLLSGNHKAIRTWKRNAQG